MLLGQILIQKKLIDQRQLESALEEQQLTKEFLGNILVSRRMISEEDLTRVLSEQFSMPYVRLKGRYIDWEFAMTFPSSLVLEDKCFPLSRGDEGVTVAIVNPLDAL